jgi:ABC-type amino acid transport substrate-binding protein
MFPQGVLVFSYPNLCSAVILAALSFTASAEELRIGIEKNSKTNLPVVMTAFEPMANAIRSSGALKDVRLSIDAVDGLVASHTSQSPSLILAHSYAANAIRASGEYTPIATFDITTSDRLTLLSSKASGIDTPKELTGKRVIVGKQGGYVSAATKLWLSKEGVDVSTVQFKHVRYADLKLSMMQAGQAEAAIAVDRETINAWKAAGGLATQIGSYPTKQLLVHSSVNADTKAKLKKLFEAGSMSPTTKSALTTAGLRPAGVSVASAD